jgi:glycerol uptake facilitator-like aquaporin
MTAREQFEQEHFNISPAKVGRRYHAAAAWGPSAWRKTLKYWAAFVLGIVLGAIGAGVLAVVVGVVR